MVVTTDTPPAELASRLAARNAVLESRVLELEAQLRSGGGPSPSSVRKRKRDRSSEAAVAGPPPPSACSPRGCHPPSSSAEPTIPPPPTISRRAAARQREEAANAEISRLRAELGTLRAEGCPGHLAQERRREEGPLLLPRRALTLAGFWNVLPNDLLEVTPALIAAVEARGGTVLRRDGMQTCFRIKERKLVTRAVCEVMAARLPQYHRRKGEGGG